MKKAVFLFLTMLTVIFVSGQDNNAKDPKDIKIDSLTTQLDTVSGQLKIYSGIYNVLKEKVFKYNFNPAKTSFLIDSLRASRDSAFSIQSRISTMAADSLIVMLRKNKELMARVDSVKRAWAADRATLTSGEAVTGNAVNVLTKLKEMLDNKIITDAEYLVLKKKYIQKIKAVKK